MDKNSNVENEQLFLFNTNYTSMIMIANEYNDNELEALSNTFINVILIQFEIISTKRITILSEFD